MFYFMKSYPLMLVRTLELRLTPLSLPCVWAAGVLSLCVSLRPSGRRAPPRMLLLLFIWLPRYKSRVSLKRHSVLINETAGERRRGCRWREGAASGGRLHHQPAGRRRFISPPRGCESGCNLTPHACRKTSNTPPPSSAFSSATHGLSMRHSRSSCAFSSADASLPPCLIFRLWRRL